MRRPSTLMWKEPWDIFLGHKRKGQNRRLECNLLSKKEGHDDESSHKLVSA